MLKDNYYTEPTEVDQLVFAKLVPPDHYLQRVKQLLDFERFRELVKDCYSPAMGRTAEDPVRLIKLEFLQFHDRLSDREVVADHAFLGPVTKYFVHLDSGKEVMVPRQNQGDEGDRLLRRGERVMVSWDRAWAKVFRRTG